MAEENEDKKVVTPSKDEKAPEREEAVLPKGDDEEVSGADAPIETNKPTEVDPKYDLADTEAEVDEDDDDSVIDPIGGGKLSKDSPFNPYRGIE